MRNALIVGAVVAAFVQSSAIAADLEFKAPPPPPCMWCGLYVGGNAGWAVGRETVTTTSFFPVPPDVMLVPMVLRRRDKAWRIAAVCTIASVLGGLLGYAIGMFLMDSLGGAILHVFGYAGERRAALEAQYAEYGLWVILIKGLTPIP